jgi:hypothetical protein
MYIQWKKEWTTPAVVGVVSFAAGVGAGYFYCTKKYGKDIDFALSAFKDLEDGVVIDETTTTTFEFDIPRSKDVKILDERVKHGIEGIDLLKPFAEVVDAQTAQHTQIPEDVETNNIFQNDWDVAEEMANRSPDAPYVIHLNEFVNKESGYHQSSLEYYEGDSILSDENSVPIYAPEKIVGRLEWGRGSMDPDVVYIRNERLSAEYEITRNPGSFQIEVLGLEAEQAAEDDELKHSNSIRRFRRDME